MKDVRKSQDGFGVIEAFLTLVIVGIIGFVGWYVWSQNMKPNTNQSNTSNTQNEPQKKTGTSQKNQISTSDISSSWVKVSSGKKAFSFKVPDGWKLFRETGSDVFMGEANPASVTYSEGVKAEIKDIDGGGSDAPIRFNIFTTDKSYQGWTEQDSTKTDFVTTSGLKGVRYFKLYGPRSEKDIGPGPVAGEKAYEYLFDVNGKHIHAAYVILPGDPDNLKYAELALKSLEIN